jgi:2,4-dienoyl-CoA reductase (NADPH2)
MNVPQGAYSYFSREIKRAIHNQVPVFASNRINDPAVAEAILRERKADAVCIGRGLICDPEFTVKSREGRFLEIRKCVACNQGCFDAILSLRPACCMRNPIVGNEGKYDLSPSLSPKQVIIIGAGVAGLECARIAVTRGHSVQVFEKSDRIGGQAWYAAAPPGRESINEIITWYQEEMERLHVPIEFNHQVTPEELSSMSADVVVFATGAFQRRPPIPGIDLPLVHNAWDFLDPASNIDPGDRCAVIGGGATGIETALALAEFGSFSPEIAGFLNYYDILDAENSWRITRTQRKVYLLELLDKLGSNFGRSTRWMMLQDMQKHDIEALTNASISKIEMNSDQKGTIEYTQGETVATIDDLDAIFVATSVASENALEGSAPEGSRVVKIGDAKKTADLMKAIHEGFKAAIRL